MKYSIRIPFVEFQEMFCDDIMTAQFNKHVDDDGLIEIDYRYGPCVNLKTEIIWKVSEDDTKKTRKLRYGHSSPFAQWWCSLTDEMEEELTCPNCEMVNGPVEFKTDIGNGDVMVCEDCYNSIEENS